MKNRNPISFYCCVVALFHSSLCYAQSTLETNPPLYTGMGCSQILYSNKFMECQNNASTNMNEITKCYEPEIQYWNKELNREYLDTLSGQKALDNPDAPDPAKLLKKAQQLWIKYRDANCAYYDSMPGTISRVNAAECELKMTAQRVQELEDMGRHE